MRFVSLAPAHPLRERAERHIRATYRREYDATIGALPDWLVALVDGDDMPTCAAGLRLGWADCFSGCYLDDEIEVVLARLGAHHVARNCILEVTTLAGSGRGGAFDLIGHVRALSLELGMAWGVFTATTRLRTALRRAGYAFVELVPAERDRVADPAAWGSYYRNDPWVCAIGHGALDSGMPLQSLASLPARATASLHA